MKGTRQNHTTGLLAILTLVVGMSTGSALAQDASSALRTEPSMPTDQALPDPLQAQAWDFKQSSIALGKDVDLSLGVAGNQACVGSLADCGWWKSTSEGALSVGARWQAASKLALSLGIRSGQLSTRAPMSDLSAAIGSTEDVSLTCELATEAWGELELGLQFSRWQQADSLSLTGTETSAAEPGRAAALALGWRLGAFSGDLRGRYMEMLGTNPLSPRETLDVNFAWRTPWNGSVSVGAKNVLNTRNDDALETQIDDLLGRVPYVRYQQDL